ncbi:DUF3343 domain-containing protein [Clostridium intestinale]|uniref:DUF3343 domain-containing protein n=1 Tax=Clostridium intestinale TaxID=36845 RepID=UPI0028E393EA|nr:DUF3343 domain-containing protein [Clostridium intestinale]
MDVEIFSLITFDSTHSAIRAEKELMNDINVRIIPVPREISSGCGLSLKLDTNNIDKAREILISKNIKTSGYYFIKKIGLSKEVTCYET